ncbi:uncharacterized protein LOC133794020 isoform X1 [Humulus lupulus]|uniref:uncharacterized protein LOC133794020 isoform X1 n=1 Tax=Humulus lupulus TaxID=3486 RepID=UPI002B4021FE|nr:uncharacterized protein LOC133794020 isoform X1 [Humulus lupulus]
MKSLFCTSPITFTISPLQPSSSNSTTFAFASLTSNFLVSSLQFRTTQHQHSYNALNSLSPSEGEDLDAQVEDLRVPDHWLLPSKALECLIVDVLYNHHFGLPHSELETLCVKESEWLRITLHKWLDDEYCPEPTNVEISKVASYCYYKCLIERQTDLGEILLKMARELETISYQESFHGAFSSANAAINLIAQRINQPHLS